MLSEAKWIHRAAAVFQGAGSPLYIVGGAVRNPLLDLPISDVDVCGPARPEAVLAMCEGTEVRAHLRAAHFGTVELHLTDPDGTRHMAEYTTFREDSYRCGHRPDQVRFTTDIAVDALRRDFSVNALYRQVFPDGLGPVIDPTGGLGHLRRGVLHTVTADPDQVLKDDGLRILRAARFQAELDLEPTDALLESLTRYAPLLRDIARERLREELQKTLLADWRYPQLKRRRPGTESGLRTILHIGAWPELLGGKPVGPEKADPAGYAAAGQSAAGPAAGGSRAGRSRRPAGGSALFPPGDGCGASPDGMLYIGNALSRSGGAGGAGRAGGRVSDADGAGADRTGRPAERTVSRPSGKRRAPFPTRAGRLRG